MHDSVQEKIMLREDQEMKTLQFMTLTLDSDVDLQTWLTVLCSWTAQHHFELHVCNIHCVRWIGQ